MSQADGPLQGIVCCLHLLLAIPMKQEYVLPVFMAVGTSDRKACVNISLNLRFT